MSDLATLSTDVFAPHLNSTFTLEFEGGAVVPVTLAACVENPRATMPGSPRTAFSLFFECPADSAPQQGGDLTVAHPELGRIGPVHAPRIMPAAAGPTKAVFQAVFN